MTQQVLNYRSERSKLLTEISRISDFQKDLGAAENSYERAMLHKKVEAEFSDGNPSKLHSIKNAQINKIDRNLQKCIQRINVMVNIHCRAVEKLIIDGNNLSYINEIFIGVQPIVALTEYLLSKNHRVLLVFDKSICKLLGMTEPAIINTFPKNVDVHVTSNAKGADETILKVASTYKSSYVISNDKFAEFRSLAAVREKRLIRHEIMRNRLLIHDLEINIPW